MTEIYVHNGDVGTIFRLVITDTAGVPIDVSTATAMIINFQDPLGNKTQKTAAFTTDGKDGKIQYATIAGDIDKIGTWQIQGYIETSLGKFWTKKGAFNVYSTLATV